MKQTLAIRLPKKVEPRLYLAYILFIILLPTFYVALILMIKIEASLVLMQESRWEKPQEKAGGCKCDVNAN